ncbi:MAG TPA: hypothetical protein VME42_21590 [Steroidobacteraceae bacterium]|nr:hypothetical protein [Steroidobacteraceae bacterium]
MRIAVVVGVCVLAACAGDRLVSTPPGGVNLSGQWKLDEADSDDAQRLLQSQLVAATANASAGGQTQTSSRRGGRQQLGPVAMGPVMPSVLVLDEGLRWPGKLVSIEQSGPRVTFTSSGSSARECVAGERQPRESLSATRGRGDAPPPRCGWDGSTLVVESGEPEEDRPPYNQRFNLSSDGRQLIEVVTFTGGRSNGFTASRVWDRVTAPSPGGAQR